MDNITLSKMDVLIIQQQLSKRTDEEIALIINKPVDLVHQKISELTNVGSRKKSLAQLISDRLEANKKRDEELQREIEKRQADRLDLKKHKQAEKEQRKIQRQKERDQVKQAKLKERINNPVQRRGHRAPQPSNLRAQYQVERKRNREPTFKTVTVDYSQLISVRIDRKTVIYAKPGQDIEELKQQFLKNYKKVSDE